MKEIYKLCYSAIDLTTLSARDTEESVRALAAKAAAFYGEHPEQENVASVCVYPAFVETLGLALDGTPMRITSVAGGFPASQTFLEVKMLEVAMAVESGADEIDIVLNVGKMLAGAYDEVRAEVAALRDEAADATLKVILETGALVSDELISKASWLAMEAGADFIKTSTGKLEVVGGAPTGATPEAATAMCRAIREYHEKTGRRVGFKASGGIRTREDAVTYYRIVEKELGPDWLTPRLFRLGASSLADDLLKAILE